MKKLAFAIALSISSLGAVSAMAADAVPAAAAAGIRKPTGTNISKFWNKIAWKDMSPEEQGAWGVLGWSVENWHGPKSSAPASDKKDWDKLTQAEQEAATALGYTSAAWQNE